LTGQPISLSHPNAEHFGHFLESDFGLFEAEKSSQTIGDGFVEFRIVLQFPAMVEHLDLRV
jgi:hypothetical protein